jgi:hypothetical protein
MFPPAVVDQFASLWARCSPTDGRSRWLFVSAVLLRLRSGFDYPQPNFIFRCAETEIPNKNILHRGFPFKLKAGQSGAAIELAGIRRTIKFRFSVARIPARLRQQ